MNLLFAAFAACPEIDVECFVLYVVPTNTNAESKAAAGKDVDLGCLFGDERGLSLGKN